MRRHLPLLTVIVALVAFAASASSASADTFATGVVAQANSCVGAPCTTSDTAKTLTVKSGDTPAIRFDQTGGPFAPWAWDIAGNEANFFVRDVNNSTLVFRIFPGAPANSLMLNANGYVTAAGQFALPTSSSSGSFDASGILDKIDQLAFENYTASGSADPHVRPAFSDFATQFGGSSSYLSIPDIATVALAGVKTLDARVTDLPYAGQISDLTDRIDDLESANATLKSQLNAVPGQPDLAPLTTRVATAEATNAALVKQNKSLAKSLKSLQKQVKKLSRKR